MEQANLPCASKPLQSPADLWPLQRVFQRLGQAPPPVGVFVDRAGEVGLLVLGQQVFQRHDGQRARGRRHVVNRGIHHRPGIVRSGAFPALAEGRPQQAAVPIADGVGVFARDVIRQSAQFARPVGIDPSTPTVVLQT